MLLDINRLERDGYFLLRGVPEDDLVGSVAILGGVRVDPRSPDPVRAIRPQDVTSAKQNTLSSRYGTGAFPFHTDTAHWDRPARYLVLYCVNPGEGRATLLQDTHAWALNEVERDLACRALWTTGHVRASFCMVAEESGPNLAIRYDMDCMRPMTGEALRLKALIGARIQVCNRVQIDWEAGSLLIIDNQRMVHARGSSARPDSGRIHKRMLIGGA
jgi:L-asparagine oxygenase